MGSQRVGHDWATSQLDFYSEIYISEWKTGLEERQNMGRKSRMPLWQSSMSPKEEWNVYENSDTRRTPLEYTVTNGNVFPPTVLRQKKKKKLLKTTHIEKWTDYPSGNALWILQTFPWIIPLKCHLIIAEPIPLNRIKISLKYSKGYK